MKLDSFHKILIATGQINYMAASLDSVNSEIKTIPDPQGVHRDGIEDRKKALAETVEKLTVVMNNLGDCINRWDCLCEIDQRVAKVPFEIMVEGKDETDELYEED